MDVGLIVICTTYAVKPKQIMARVTDIDILEDFRMTPNTVLSGA